MLFKNENIYYFQSLDSTNNYLSKLYNSTKIENGTVILADYQTNGKGQRGNIWESNSGDNLLFSFYINSDIIKFDNIMFINFIISISIHQFISSYCEDTYIKWPNDIYVNDKKICGILIENKINSKFMHHIVGIGININQILFANSNSTSLYLENNAMIFNKDILLIDLLKIIEDNIYSYNLGFKDNILKKFNSLLYLRNKFVSFEYEENTYIGKIIKVHYDGSIEININNTSNKYSFGSISKLKKVLSI